MTSGPVRLGPRPLDRRVSHGGESGLGLAEKVHLLVLTAAPPSRASTRTAAARLVDKDDGKSVWLGLAPNCTRIRVAHSSDQ